MERKKRCRNASRRGFTESRHGLTEGGTKKEGAETEEPEIDLEEFVKSLYDYTSNSFPKGETAVLTAVEKKYGDNAMKPAAEMMKELVTGQDQEMERIKKLAGV